jgi:plastocyanin
VENIRIPEKSMKSIASVTRRFSLALCTILLVVGSLFVAVNPASADTYTVKMGTNKGLVFEPKVVNVKPGDVVKWEVGALPPHNVVFDVSKIPGGSKDLADKMSHKGLESAGKSFELTIPADAPAGEYSYFCLPHRGAGMVGKVVVAG